MVIVIDDSKKKRMPPRPREQKELVPEKLIKHGITAVSTRQGRKSQGVYTYNVTFRDSKTNKWIDAYYIKAGNKQEMIKIVNTALANLSQYSKDKFITVGEYRFKYNNKVYRYDAMTEVSRAGEEIDLRKLNSPDAPDFDIQSENPLKVFKVFFENVEKNYQLFKSAKPIVVHYKGFKVVAKPINITNYTETKIERDVELTYNDKKISNCYGPQHYSIFYDSDLVSTEKIIKSLDKYITFLDEQPLYSIFKKQYMVLVKDVTNKRLLVKSKKSGRLYMAIMEGMFINANITDDKKIASMVGVAIQSDYTYGFTNNNGIMKGRYGSKPEFINYFVFTDPRTNKLRVYSKTQYYFDSHPLKSNLHRLMKPYIKNLKNTPEEKTKQAKMAKEKIALAKKRAEAQKLRDEIQRKEEELRKLRG